MAMREPITEAEKKLPSVLDIIEYAVEEDTGVILYYATHPREVGGDVEQFKKMVASGMMMVSAAMGGIMPTVALIRNDPPIGKCGVISVDFYVEDTLPDVVKEPIAGYH